MNSESSGALPRDELNRFEEMLRCQRADTDAALAELRASLDDVRLARGDGTADDEHDPEGSTLSSDWSRISGLDFELSAKLSAIDTALQRMADGTYGSCLRCGRPVGRGRLEARPAAATCIECQRRLDARR